MPTFSSEIVLSSDAVSAGTAGIDNGLVKGALKAFSTFSALESESIERLKSGQLAYVSNTSTWYEVTITQPDFITTFAPSASFATFSSFSGAGGGGGGNGIFSTTGSVESTTNDLEITGSVKIRVDAADEFHVVSGSVEVFKVNNQGIVQFAELDAPTAVTGGMFLSSSGDFYLSIV